MPTLDGYAAWLEKRKPQTISTLDTHTAGEPLRIILQGVELPAGATILERRRAAQGAWDRIRRRLMFEPRGHEDMYGALIVPPVSPGALFGVLFMHNEGYSTGCGHATIALAKVAVELGWTPAVEPVTPVLIDAPSGLLKAYARVRDGRVTSSGFENVASFAPLLDQSVDVPGMGKVTFDLAYGGAFYAFVDADGLGLELRPDNAKEIVRQGMAIKHAVMANFPVRHPTIEDMSFLYGTIFTGKASDPGAHSRHACVFADGALDRSPTGTGVAARVAILHARKRLAPEESLRFESITGGHFTGRVLRETRIGGMDAVIPEIEGTSSITGRHDFLLEDDDPFPEGFRVH